MKRRLLNLFLTTSLLLVFASSSFAGTLLPMLGSPATSAAAPQYALYFKDDPATKSNLVRITNDNDLNENDVNSDYLNKSAIQTKGGPLGTQQLDFDPDASDHQDQPIYKLDYFCMPSKGPGPGGYVMSADKPDDNIPYIRYTLGVAILPPGHIKGFVTDKDYETRVGLLGDDNVGSVHFPERNPPGQPNIPAADFDLPGNGGDLDIRQSVNTGDYFKQSGTEKYTFDAWSTPTNKLPPLGGTYQVFDKCRLDPHSEGGNAISTRTINLQSDKISDAVKKQWDQAQKDAGKGDTVAEAVAAHSSDTTGGDTQTLNCNAGYNPLNWLICGIVKGLVSVLDGVDKIINSLLSVGTPDETTSGDPSKIFDTEADCKRQHKAVSSCAAGEAYHKAWASFRNIALGLLVISGLVMVIAQALGMEILDAYAIRKVLPRLLIVSIGITLSWPILRFTIQMFNDFGFGVRHLIEGPFGSLSNTIQLGGGQGMAVYLATAGVFASFSIFGLLSFVGTALLAAFIAFLVLVLRQVIVVLLIISAPVALVCYILPNTQKVWKLWFDSFSGAMLMFPIISAMIASGRAFSAVAVTSGGDTVGSFIAFAGYFGPYFLIPATFKFAGGALRQIGGFVNDRGKGAFDGLRNMRSNDRKKNMQGLKDGTRFEGKKWIPGSIKAANAVNEASKGVGTGWKGRYGFGERGALARSYVDQAAQAEMQKTPGMQAIKGKNDYNRILAAGMGDERRGRAALAKHLADERGDDGKPLYTPAEIDQRVNTAAKAAHAAGAFTKAHGVAAFYNMARDGTAIRDVDDLAELAAIAGQGSNNNTLTYAAEAASISRQVGRPDLAAATDPIAELAFAKSDTMFNRGLFNADANVARANMAHLSHAAWESGAGGEVAYTKFSTAKGRAVRNDTRRAVDVVKAHKAAVENGTFSPYSAEDVQFAAATLLDSKNAIDLSQGKLNNRTDAAQELAKDEGALDWYLDTQTSVVPEAQQVGRNADGTPVYATPLSNQQTQPVQVDTNDDGTPVYASPIVKGPRTTTNREVVQKIIGDRYASMTPEQRKIAEQTGATTDGP